MTTQLVKANEPKMAPITVTNRRNHFGAGASIKAQCGRSTMGMWKT